MFLESCDPVYVLNVENQSDRAVYFYMWFVPNGGGGPFYPDTSLVNPVQGLRLLRPGESIDRGAVGYLEADFQALPSDTLSVYFFDPDSLEAYPVDDIIDGYRVLRRYDLSYEDIRLLDNRIPYPPTYEMRAMRMYPPWRSQGE